ncbi:MAG: cation-translocating P-type ATPase [Flavisolibacter sp.]
MDHHNSLGMEMDELSGLSEEEVRQKEEQFGKNVLHINETRRFFSILLDIVKEPMFLLLTFACILYFILGEPAEGFMMIAAIAFVSAISVYQELKSTHALASLKQLTEPRVKVIRNGREKEALTEDLVPGDLVVLEEGNRVPADARVVKENDLSIDESVVTGESFPVEKHLREGENLLYQGTVVNSGRCYAIVSETGARTVLGKIGRSIITYTESKTLLQDQIDVFVKRFALFGILAFLLIFLINFHHNGNLISSLLFGLTLAMSAIPEEIPVAFSSFMALGAYHMSRLGIISRQPQTIENLGAINMICLDKTGTITENKMRVDRVYDFAIDRLMGMDDPPIAHSKVLYYALLACEENPFDSMERALVDAFARFQADRPVLQFISEFPLQGQPPMMTHIYQGEAGKIAASKGAVERIIRVCRLDRRQAERVEDITKSLARLGHRVLGVARAFHKEGPLPASQDEFNWEFLGLVSLYDPPRPYMHQIFREFYDAGIEIKLITGDFPETALTIARETGMKTRQSYLTGQEVMAFTEEALIKKIPEVNVFARMFPEAKLKVIDAVRKSGNIVAMTGDGVNDAPALKAANIGIAIGKKGTEVARQSADLILTDDNLQKLTEAIRQGRKIFNNFKKAVRYILSIHIPIILVASLPLILGWRYPNIFTPIHIIFLELIMGPTCSVFFEREPAEDFTMKIPPRPKATWIFHRDEFLISILQGLLIASGVLLLYYYFMDHGASLTQTRTVVFTTLILSNIFLTFTNRSFTEPIYKTIRYPNNLVLPVLLISLIFLGLIHFLPFVRALFGMTLISAKDFFVCLIVSFCSVFWFEAYKMLPFAGPAFSSDHSPLWK